MKTSPPLFDHPLFRPLIALAFVSGSGCALLLARLFLLGQRPTHFYLAWNLILAWLPLWFAFAVHRRCERGNPWRWSTGALAFAWLLFFPNAPYICTDLIHLGPKSHDIFWADLVLILIFALTGLVLGFLSLLLMQTVVARRWGWRAGWGFAVTAAMLAGYGVYLGRFLRWNSWDVLLDPLGLASDLARLLSGMAHHPTSTIISALFATLILLGYVIFYGMTHLPGTLSSPVQDSSRT